MHFYGRGAPEEVFTWGLPRAGEAVAGVRRRHPDMLRPRVIIRIRRRVRCDRRGQDGSVEAPVSHKIFGGTA